MGNTTNSFKSTQNVTNDITQINQSSCIASVQIDSGGNVVIIEDSRINGNVVGSVVKVSTDASCIMSSSAQADIQNILKASAEQTKSTENGIFSLDFGAIFDSLGYTDNSIEIEENVTNNILQLNSSNCSSNIIISDEPNYIYVRGSTVGGNVIGSDVTADANASCTITNNSKVYVFNDLLADGKQKKELKNVFFTIVIAFTVIIGLIIVGVIILFSTGAIGSVGYKKLKISKKTKPPQTNPPQTNPLQPVQLQTNPLQPVQLQTNPPQPVQLQTNPPQPVQLQAKPPQPVQLQTKPPQPVQLQTNPPQPVQLQRN
jgi:hypothetical protein